MRRSLSVLLAFFLTTSADAAEGLTDCQVRLLGHIWGLDVAGAEARIRDVQSQGDEDGLSDLIIRAMSDVEPTGFAVCTYYEYGFDYNDAEALAQAWGMSDPYEAKARIEAALFVGEEHKIAAELKALGPRDEEVWVDPIVAAGFTSCDVDLLSVAWKKDPIEVKNAILLAADKGKTSKIQKKLEKARPKLQDRAELCQFWTLPYSYEDAERLADYWNLSVEEAKVRVEQKARGGYLDWVRMALEE